MKPSKPPTEYSYNSMRLSVCAMCCVHRTLLVNKMFKLICSFAIYCLLFVHEICECGVKLPRALFLLF